MTYNPKDRNRPKLSPEEQCKQKKHYETREDAIKSFYRFHAVKNKHITSYQCKVCGKWLWGHTPVRLIHLLPNETFWGSHGAPSEAVENPSM